MSFPEFPGAHSRDELLERVRRQGARRRAVRWGAVGASVAGAIVLGSVLAVASGGSPRHTHVAASDNGTTTIVVTTTTSAVETPTTAAPATVPTTQVVPSKGRPSSMPNTTTTTAPPPVCGTGDFASSVTTDRSSYPQSATVTIVLRAQNVSGHACATAPPAWLAAHHRGASVQTTSGSPIWDDRKPATSDLALPSYVVPPGGTITLSTPWDQRTCTSPTFNPQTDANGCTGPPAAPGQYKAFDGWNAYKPPGGSWENTVPSPAFQIQ